MPSPTSADAAGSAPGALARAWHPVAGLSLDGAAYTAGGTLILPCVSSYPAAMSGSVLALAGSSAYIRADAVPAVGNGSTEAHFGLRYDENNFVMFLYGGTNSLGARLKIGGTQTDHWGIVSPYSGTTNKYWRIRESGGTIYFDTGPGTGSFTNAWSGAHGLSAGLLAAMRVRLACGYWGTETSPGQFTVGAVNAA